MTSKPGHHQPALQTLPQSVGVPQTQVIVLDALRKQRHAADYAGDLVSEATAAACCESAIDLLAHVRSWLTTHRPDLL